MKIKTTTAAVLTESYKPLEVAEITLPETLRFGQVLVELAYSGICGAQINEIDAAKGPDKFLPHLLGHEGSGVVLEVGEGVKRIKPGDHVVMHWRPSGGIQSDPAKYTWKGGATVNSGWVTTFNRHSIVSENRLTVIPSNYDMRTAPLYGCAVTTGLGVVKNDAELGIGQSVVIFGLGGVGLSVCQMANLASANPIIGVDIQGEKLEMAKKWGATHAFNSGDNMDYLAKIKEVVGPNGADVVIDTTGNPRVIETAYELTHPDGKTILVGVPRKGQNVNLYTLPLHFKKVLKGSHGGGIQPDIEIPRLIKLQERGRLVLEGMITHEFSLENINEAITTVKTGRAGRVIVKM